MNTTSDSSEHTRMIARTRDELAQRKAAPALPAIRCRQRRYLGEM